MNSNGINKQPATHHITPSHFQPQAQAPVGVVSGPRCETVVVTPELAESWLKANTRNRTCRRSRIKAYARDMAAGRWLFSTQGITFGTDGSLIDGQHRLNAVVEAGVAVTMIVWFDVPPAARTVIDIGAPRNLADIAELTTKQSAVTQAMLRGIGNKNSSSITMAEKTAFYRRFSAQIDGAISRFVTTSSGITQATVLGAVARASLHMNEKDITRFCEVLQSGVSNEPRDVTVIRLRDRLLQGVPSSGGGQVLKGVYALTASALRAFGESRVLAKLVPVSTDPFPLPVTGESE